MIEAVLFDLDETLLDRNASIEFYLRHQHRRWNLNHIPLEAYCERFKELDQHGYADKEEVFHSLIAEFGIRASVEELSADFRQNAWKSCRVFPDAWRVLRQLRSRGYRLGIVTNGSAESQRANLATAGLASLVDVVLISAEEGVRRPDPGIFLRAAERLGVSAVKCLFVGDNPQGDIVGAHRAGMRTVWVKRHLSWPDGLEVAPTYTMRTLEELLDLKL